MNFRLIKTTIHKKHGADRICCTHQAITQVLLHALQITIWIPPENHCVYLSMYDNRCLRYFKGHKERFGSFELLVP
ncbi:hypothetical protein ACFX1S_023670 [Malus domestica]|uniref:Uncharacterized protein n=1 Tax=Malus domestica TaxID=3750 RepID=A0A498HGP1_MALDO|nr:hypothetical protein DVH24_037268 [Malus domestica]